MIDLNDTILSDSKRLKEIQAEFELCSENEVHILSREAATLRRRIRANKQKLLRSSK